MKIPLPIFPARPVSRSSDARQGVRWVILALMSTIGAASLAYGASRLIFTIQEILP